MADNVINQGGVNIFESKNGYLQTVLGSDTFKLDKAITMEFNLAPDHNLKYSADQSYDLVSTGPLGEWNTELLITSDIVSAKTIATATLNTTDKNTLSYWLYELANKRFPSIQFRETLKDTDTSPHTAPFNFIGLLTQMKKTREDDVHMMLMSGLIKSYASFKKT